LTDVTPLILVTNDDGVRSPGLAAAAEALAGLGDLLIVAPREQQTSTGRSYRREFTTAVSEEWIEVAGRRTLAFAVDGTPAQTVLLGLLQIAPRTPALVVAGINYGENLGTGVTISGTIGACLEAAASQVLGLAVSVETALEHHYQPVATVDFTIAKRWTRHFAARLLAHGLPSGVDILKVDVPASATWETPWRLTRLSRQRYYQPVVRSGNPVNEKAIVGYYIGVDHATLEPDSDIYAFTVERVVSVTPLTGDLTAPVSLSDLAARLR